MSDSDPRDLSQGESVGGESAEVESSGDADASDSRQSELTGTFLKELLILIVGLGIGFFWSQYSEASQEAHLVIGLLIVILCLVRYIYLFVKR